MELKDEHSSKAFFSIEVTEGGIDIDTSDMHAKKERESIDFIKEGVSNVILFKWLQRAKAFSPIVVTEDGNVIPSSDVQPTKAFESIKITEEGIIISLRLRDSAKAFCPIDLIEGGIAICSRFLRFWH